MLLEIKDLAVRYEGAEVVKGVSMHLERRRDRHPHRQQRGRQDRPSSGPYRGSRLPTSGRDLVRRQAGGRPQPQRHRQAGHRPGAPRPRPVPLHVRGREPEDGRLPAQGQEGDQEGPGGDTDALPAAQGAGPPAGLHPQRGRAADARHRLRGHVQAAHPAARRAVDGALAADGHRDRQDRRARSTRLGTTVLLVEQNSRLALKLAKRAYVLETGNIVVEGAAEELMHSEHVRKAYLGE